MQRLPVCVQKEPRLLLRLPRDVCCKQRRSLHVRQRLVHGQKRSQLIAIRLCQVPRVQACVQVYPSSNVQRWTHEAFFKTEILGTKVKAIGESHPSRAACLPHRVCRNSVDASSGIASKERKSAMDMSIRLHANQSTPRLDLSCVMWA